MSLAHLNIWQGIAPIRGFPCGLAVKTLSAVQETEQGLIPGLGRCSGEGNGNPLQCSCLENPTAEEPDGPQSMGSQKCRTQLSD